MNKKNKQMKYAYLFTLILIITVLNSCKKDVEKVDITTSIRITNLSDFNFDFLYLYYVNTPHNHVYGDSLLEKITDFAINDTSEYYNLAYVSSPLGVQIVIDNKAYNYEWNSPVQFILPTSPQLQQVIPEGKYHFIITNVDTTNNTFIFALSQYENDELFKYY